MHRTRISLAWIALVLVAAAVCDRGGEQDRSEPAVTFDQGSLRIETAADTLHLSVEIAERAEQRAHGLMERSTLPADAGMIFVYEEPQDPDAGFYMFRTRIPLDIAFMDGEGQIIAIQAMDPCESPNPRLCRIYSPGVPYQSALEVNRGYFARQGVGLGDRVVFQR